MRILSLAVAGVLALSFLGPGSVAWASPGSPTVGESKAPAKKSCEKPKPAAKAGSPNRSGSKSKSGEATPGSSARNELLKNRPQGLTKTAPLKKAAPKGKAKAKS